MCKALKFWVALSLCCLVFRPCRAVTASERKVLLRRLLELEEEYESQQRCLERCSCSCQAIDDRQLVTISNQTNPLEGNFFRIGVVVDPPLVMRRENSTIDSKPMYEGVFIEMLEAHAEALGFNYEIVESPDGAPGIKKDDGTFNGAMGLIQRGEVDMLYAISILSERAEIVSFTNPIRSTGLRIVTAVPGAAKNDAFFLLSPFSNDLWMYLILTILLLSGVFAFVDYFSPYGKGSAHDRPSWANHTVAVILNNDLFMNVNHLGLATSLLTFVWAFCALALITLYTSYLVSFLTVSKLDVNIKGLNDLIVRSMKVGVVESSHEKVWINEKLPALLPLVKYYRTATDCVAALRASEVNALILKEPLALYNTYVPPCTEMLVGERFAHGFQTIGLPLNSPYIPWLNDIIIKEVDTGELEEFDEKYLMDQCQLQVHQDMLNNDVIKPSQVRGIFYILLFAVMCSLTALLYQMVRFRIVLRRFGAALHENELDENSFIALLLDKKGGSTPDDIDPNILILVRKAKVLLRSIGLKSSADLAVLLGAADSNADRFLDCFEIERLRNICRDALKEYRSGKNSYWPWTKQYSHSHPTSPKRRLSSIQLQDQRDSQRTLFGNDSVTSGQLFVPPDDEPRSPAKGKDGDPKRTDDAKDDQWEWEP